MKFIKHLCLASAILWPAVVGLGGGLVIVLILRATVAPGFSEFVTATAALLVVLLLAAITVSTALRIARNRYERRIETRVLNLTRPVPARRAYDPAA